MIRGVGGRERKGAWEVKGFGGWREERVFKRWRKGMVEE